MNKASIGIIVVGALSFLLAGCDEGVESSDRKMNRQQEQLSAEAASEIGMPAIVNFQEKRMMKTILELRDQATLITYTYTQDINGRLHKRCDSIGYGLPYATQYTNPQKIGYAGSQVGVLALPQADPNGLFSPAEAHGTWILCKDPEKDPKKNKGVMPVYAEPDVIVSPFPLIDE